MAKYRDLRKDELQNFEKEFVDYLVVNGITADDWVKLKDTDKARAEKIISLFSDVIFEGVMRKVNFLQLRTARFIQTIQCQSMKFIMVAIKPIDENVDLNEFQFTADTQLKDFEIHKGEKPYTVSREEAIFEMTQQGYEIADGKLFKALILATTA